MADDVQLTDLEVIQRYSLAVRGATASRDELVAALQADLDWLRGGRRPAATPQQKAPQAKAAAKTPVKAPATAPATAPAKAARASSRVAAQRPAKRAGRA